MVRRKEPRQTALAFSVGIPEILDFDFDFGTVPTVLTMIKE